MKTPTTEGLFRAEATLRIRAREFAMSSTDDTRRALRVAAREYGRLADEIDKFIVDTTPKT